MIYEDIMLVRANGISEALLSTGAYLPEGKGGCTLFLCCPGKLDCVWNVGEQVQTGCPGVGLISQRGRVACAVIDRGKRGARGVAPPAREQQTYARQLISLVQLIMCQRHFVNQRQPA